MPYLWKLAIFSQNNKEIKKKKNTNRFSVRSPGPASSLSMPEGATSLPPGLITSLHTPVHPLITSLHTPVHLLITSLHTPVCTHSSLSAVPNVWTIYAPQPHPSGCRDYIYQHSHVHVCISLCLLSDRLHSVSCTRDTSTTLPSGVSRSWLLFCFCLFAFDLIK